MSSEALAVETDAQRIIEIYELQTFLVPWKASTVKSIHDKHVLYAWSYANQNARHRHLPDPNMLHSYQLKPTFDRQVRMLSRIESSGSS